MEEFLAQEQQRQICILDTLTMAWKDRDWRRVGGLTGFCTVQVGSVEGFDDDHRWGDPRLTGHSGGSLMSSDHCQSPMLCREAT